MRRVFFLFFRGWISWQYRQLAPLLQPTGKKKKKNWHSVQLSGCPRLPMLLSLRGLLDPGTSSCPERLACMLGAPSLLPSLLPRLGLEELPSSVAGASVDSDSLSLLPNSSDALLGEMSSMTEEAAGASVDSLLPHGSEGARSCGSEALLLQAGSPPSALRSTCRKVFFSVTLPQPMTSRSSWACMICCAAGFRLENSCACICTQASMFAVIAWAALSVRSSGSIPSGLGSAGAP
mmetsp:Transcript_16127/g.35412  ORF Transcript_16127/g.35412 Transcript_16127/m.35412 type:complete len:235 (+) Transcript_16127:1-705(+)